ncbi:hypothetical protein AGMMS50276_10140 [Synergistales bacterium]|nr:hypothetical protein AGMMS50276_10140 [Synergistales bacterium]
MEEQERAERVREIKALSPLSVEIGTPLDKKSAESIAREFGPMKNEHDDRVALFPMATVGKILKHQGFDVSTILGDIPILFETSIYGWPESEILRKGHKEHTNIASFHHYVNKFSDGTDTYFIRFSVTERKGKAGKTGDSFIHSTAISGVSIYKTNDDLSQSVPAQGPGLKERSSFIDTRLQEFFDSVNTDTEISKGRPERGDPVCGQHDTENPLRSSLNESERLLGMIKSKTENFLRRIS